MWPDGPQPCRQDHDQGRPQLRDPQDHPADRRGRRREPRLRQAGRARPRHEAPGRGHPQASSARSSSRWSPPTGTGSTGREAKIADPAEGLDSLSSMWPRKPSTRCRTTLKRIEAGLDLLAKDAQAAEAFRFMNRAMWLQRTHSLFAERVRRGGTTSSTTTSTSRRTGPGIRSSSPSSC